MSSRASAAAGNAAPGASAKLVFFMLLKQFLHTNPVCASYLFGCGGKASAAVVDPIGEIEPYLQAAQDTGMKILYVVDTHIHADHASSGWRLAEAAGAQYVLFAGADAKPAFHCVRYGDVLPLGNVTVEVLHTPGHTPEHIGLLVTDRTGAAEPWFVLTGHTLMVGDVGRTELATALEAGARDLFRSLGRLKGLPDYVEVLPGAFSGSVCGRSLSGRTMSTIGFEKRYNKAFLIEDKDAFVAAMSKEVPPPPAGVAELRAVNAGLATV